MHFAAPTAAEPLTEWEPFGKVKFTYMNGTNFESRDEVLIERSGKLFRIRGHIFEGTELMSVGRLEYLESAEGGCALIYDTPGGNPRGLKKIQ